LLVASAKAFDIIVGNPPWDKTKFADTDFFPQYHSNYRSLKNSEKAAVQKRLLESPHIATAYQNALIFHDAANEYFKDKTVFPLNKGLGDGNLFRLFVERNLGLLNAGRMPELRAAQCIDV
jgi:type II restriction/modification system DNA methylase subunit YeeA